ncbi:cache domain-containing protein [Tautonia rosea]|uniref:cache domain-containing protein n=1 Tax=Tautonia rosea TaxID=2728037 RepID=UPI00147568AD|nr:cache domain-containing protein [Tautonia rosea]
MNGSLIPNASRIAAVIAALVGIVLIAQVVALSGFAQAQRAEAVTEGEARVELIQLGLELVMNVVVGRATEVAEELARGSIDREVLLDRIREVSESEPYLLGMTVAFKPSEATGGRLDAPFYDRPLGRFLQIEDIYDYTSPDTKEAARWYREPLERGEAMWVSGFGEAADEPYVGYSIPVYSEGDDDRVKGRPIGVVNLAVSLHELNDLFNRRYVGRRGGGALIDERGRLLAFPVFDHVREGKPYAEVVAESGSRDLVVVQRLMQGGGSGVRRCRDSSVLPGRQPGWVFYRPVPGTGWSMAVAMFEADLIDGRDQWRRRSIGVLLNVVLLMGLGLAWSLTSGRTDTLRLWTISTTAALVLTVAIGLVWALSYRYGDPPQRRGVAVERVSIKDVEGLTEFLDEHRDRMADRHRDDARVIPTWLFLRSIVFEDAHAIRVGGMIWQRYPAEDREQLTRGVIFPNLDPDAESFELIERYRRPLEQGGELVAFAFRATVRGSFDYRAYPFDRQSLPIQLAHPEADRNVVLAPDLERYPYLQRGAGPGLNRPLEVPGWAVEGSGFSYTINTYNVEWSPNDEASNARVPVLQFEILLHRRFPTPFISHIVPILIVAVLLHGVLISSSFNERQRSSSGFSAFGVLETCGAFFFAIALMHIDLRRGLDLDVITYMEMIYLIAYLILLLVVLDALVFTTSDAVPWIEYRDNLLAKLLFWPTLLGLVLAATVWTFY